VGKTPVVSMQTKALRKAMEEAEMGWFVPLGIACVKHLTEGGGFEKRINDRQGDWKANNKKYKKYGKTKKKWDRTGKLLKAVNTTLTKKGVTNGMEFKLKLTARKAEAIFRPVTFGKHLKKKPSASMKKRIFSLLDYRRPLFRWDRPDKDIMEKNLVKALNEQYKKVGL
jgi:hypothetical protein